jgi:hypothetical protein
VLGSPETVFAATDLGDAACVILVPVEKVFGGEAEGVPGRVRVVG